MGDVAASRVGVTGIGSITDRVYTCVVGTRICQGQFLLAQGTLGNHFYMYVLEDPQKNKSQ